MMELCPEPPPAADPALAGNMGETNSGSYPVMFSSTAWMNAGFAGAAAEPEGEAEAVEAACGAAVAQRMVVGSRDVVEVESLGARRDRFVGEMGPLRLRPCAVPTPPPGYVNSWKTRCC